MKTDSQGSCTRGARLHSAHARLRHPREGWRSSRPRPFHRRNTGGLPPRGCRQDRRPFYRAGTGEGTQPETITGRPCILAAGFSGFAGKAPKHKMSRNRMPCVMRRKRTPTPDFGSGAVLPLGCGITPGYPPVSVFMSCRAQSAPAGTSGSPETSLPPHAWNQGGGLAPRPFGRFALQRIHTTNSAKILGRFRVGVKRKK